MWMSTIVQLFSGTYGNMPCNSEVKACLSVSMTSTESNVANQVFLWQQQREVGGSSYLLIKSSKLVITISLDSA